MLPVIAQIIAWPPARTSKLEGLEKSLGSEQHDNHTLKQEDCYLPPTEDCHSRLAVRALHAGDLHSCVAWMELDGDRASVYG